MAQETVIAPLTGRGVVQLDLSADGTAILDLPDFSYQSGEITWGYDRWQTGRHVIQASSRDIFNSKIVPVLLSKTRMIRSRLGVTGPNETTWGAWGKYRVNIQNADASRNSASNDGYPFMLELEDQLSQLDLATQTKAWRGKISDIVTQIAVAFGFSSVSIEPTRGVVAMVQSFESDYDFIRDRLVRLAVNESGLGAYNFYMVGDTFHFHTRGWQAPTVKVLRGNIDAAAAPWTIQFADYLGPAIDVGAAGVASVVYDPLEAVTTVDTSSEADVRKLANVTYNVDPAWIIPSVRHAGQNQAQLELDLAQSRYERARAGVFCVQIGTQNVVGLSVGDVVFLELNSPSDPLVGYYTVAGLTLSQGGGSFKIVITLARGELNNIQLPTIQILEPEALVVQLEAPSAAPGRMINPAEVAASPITRVTGAGDSVTVPILPGGG